MSLRVVTFVLLLALKMAAAWTPPAFCKGLDCPKYTVIKQLGGGIELRRYDPASYVSTTATAVDKDAAMRGSFMKLFNYISGGNKGKAKVDMTAPVVTRIEPGQGPTCDSTFTISFFNPYKYQGTAVPQPTEGSVFINNMPAMEVYVLPYGGYASAATDRDKAAELIKKLEAAKEPFSTKYWFTAGYDSPYQLANRRNEVWIPRETMSATATSAEAGKKDPNQKPAAAG